MDTSLDDNFSAYYEGLLDDTYDCADRIVLNAFFTVAHSAAGLRYWWRLLNDGSDDTLDNTHLMRIPGRLSRRVRAWGKSNNIAVIDCEAGERKHEIAEEMMPSDPAFRGVFLVLVNRAPSPVWDVIRGKNGIVNIARKRSLSYVNHYSFHIKDPDWGHITIKICGHAPFPALIILNGHEYVAAQTMKAGHPFTKEGNCFTHVTDAKALAQVADSLRSKDAIGRLSQVCEGWIYSACLIFALTTEEQNKSGFRYSFSVYQAEYSRNLLFRDGAQMEQLFQSLVDRTRSLMDIPRIKTILGIKNRPHRRRKKAPRWEVVVDNPTYNLVVFKIHFGALTLKVYTKGEHVLRFEVIIHNARQLRCGRSLERFPDLISHLRGIMQRFLNAISAMDAAFISHTDWDQLPLPSQIGNTRVGGVDLHKPRIRTAMNAVVALAMAPGGFTASQIADKAHSLGGKPYSPTQAAYDLKKLRGKQFVQLVGRSRRYEPTPQGLRAMAATLILHDRVITPVLAGATNPTHDHVSEAAGTPAAALDIRYRAIQREFNSLLGQLGVAV
jgi:hypothetical protein